MVRGTAEGRGRTRAKMMPAHKRRGTYGCVNVWERMLEVARVRFHYRYAETAEEEYAVVS